MQQPHRFNIRVYAIIFNTMGQILISYEHVLGTFMTKFPGGGLEFGEGTLDCLKREAMEEFGQEIEILGHYYTTDFYQPALYFENTQLISIYYKAKLKNELILPVVHGPLDSDSPQGTIAFRWMNLNQMTIEVMTFPIDRMVLSLLKKDYSAK